jgi:hypothetical protein
MLPYKSIDIESYDEIRTQLIEILFSYTTELKTTFILTDKDKVLSHIPKLKKFLTDNNLELDICRFFITSPQDSIGIHTDGNDEFPKYLALNLPLFGCSNSYMRWWSDVELIEVREHIDGYVKNIKVFDGTGKTPDHSLALITPHLVQIDIPHDVVNFQDYYRAIFSMRFKPEPLHLWS